MAKGARGGKRVTGNSAGGGGGISVSASGGGGSASAVAKNQQPTQQADNQVKQVQPAQTMSTTYNQFVSMTDDQKADVISQNISQGVPAHLTDNSFQRFIYNMDLNDKPDVVSDAQFNSISGTTMYRTVDRVKNTAIGVTYSAPEICKQVMGGSVTRVSQGYRAIYGSGIYFANSLNGSTSYGSHHGDINQTAVMKAKLGANAKVIGYSTALSAAQKEMNSGSKLGKALKKCDYDSVAGIYAMSKGYNVMNNGAGYYNILNRNAIVMSDKISPA